MNVGSTLSAPDNDSYMLRGDYPACGSCAMPTDRSWVDDSFDLRIRGFDVSYTYDGYLITSERFRTAVPHAGTEFVALRSAPGFFSLVINRSVPFDVARRGTRFEEFCPECERFQVVTGATPAFLRVAEALPDELVRTDVEFGSGKEQSPLVVMGPGLARHLSRQEMSGLTLRPVAGLE